MIIIAGLGNPGLRYRKTRHNAGFEVIDILAKQYNISVRKKDRQSVFGTGVINGKKVTLVKPLTYMNKSGEALSAWARYYGINPGDELIVISDDIALAPGNLRIRRKGSAGGHNGLKNIISCLGTDQFLRVRIGVGGTEPGDDMITHVLGRMRKEDRIKLDDALSRAADACAMLVSGEVDNAMNRYNQKQ